MDLTTTYLGLKLNNPLMPGASPLVDDLDVVRRLEDAGAGAIVMHSLFEEQIAAEQLGASKQLDGSANTSPEATTYFPDTNAFALTPARYLEQIRKIRDMVDVPVIASLNGATGRGWVEYAKMMEQAGAHALELNLYALATNPGDDAAAVEKRATDIVRTVKGAVKIPVAVKLSQFYSSLPNFVKQLEAAGADGVVLFNRFYQPDLDLEALTVGRTLHLSDSFELPLRLRWLAVVSPLYKGSLACTGGVHTGLDAVKAIMSGAHAVQVVSALLHHGPERLRSLITELRVWLEEHEYESVAQARGSLNLAKCPNPAGYERLNYIQLLTSWHGTR